MTRITGILHEDIYTFMITSRWILFRMRIVVVYCTPLCCCVLYSIVCCTSLCVSHCVLYSIMCIPLCVVLHYVYPIVFLHICSVVYWAPYMYSTGVTSYVFHSYMYCTCIAFCHALSCIVGCQMLMFAIREWGYGRSGFPTRHNKS
jgi:hypothetical protein